MKLDDILQGNQAFLYMGRYVDEGTRTYSPFAAKSEGAPEYQPRSGRPSFELITFFAPQSQVSIYQADPQKSLLEFYIPAEQVRFVIHPETWVSSGIDNLDKFHALRIASASPTATAATPGGFWCVRELHVHSGVGDSWRPTSPCMEGISDIPRTARCSSR
jgi:hypothetical protein